MTHLEQIKKIFIQSLNTSQKEKEPYTHWLLSDIFDESDVDALLNLPFAVPRMDYSVGKRDANNDKRGYFDVERRHQYPVCGAVSDMLQSPEVVGAIEKTCGVDLEGTYLRVEYAQDSPGFWLAPHTDIGVKKFTMLIYLSRDEDAVNWGTSIYKDAQTIWGTAPSLSNHALIFIPADNTWHGYEKRPMAGLRKSLIVNYVTDEWRARHELAFPDRRVTGKAH